MSKKNQEQEEVLIEMMYDLILNTSLSEEERSMIKIYKNKIEKGKDIEIEMYHLARDIEKFAIQKNTVGNKISSDIQEFYKHISDKYLLKKNLSYGLIVMGGLFN